ncbi:MAG: chemotaxis protein CheW [Burkholderiaceae bacterium]
MANKQALRDLQGRLAQRLQLAKGREAARSWLAVECAGHGFLFPLRDAGEISPLTSLLPVAYSQPWFVGVANLRGHVHGVVDLGRFLGVTEDAAARDAARLVGFNAAFGLNCALLVERLSGLRSEEQLVATTEEIGPSPPFVGARYADNAGRVWQELNLAALAADESFLAIVA